jgi:hypothetical protein
MRLSLQVLGKINFGSYLSYIAIGYGLDDRELGVRIPVGSRIFTSPYCSDRLWGTLSLLFNEHRGIFLRESGRALSWPFTPNKRQDQEDDREFGVRVPVGSRIFTSPYCSDRLWGTLSLLSNGYRGLFPRESGRALSWPFTPNKRRDQENKSSWRSA